MILPEAPPDAVLYASAGIGVCGYLLSYWLALRNIVRADNMVNRLFRYFCLGLLFLPVLWHGFLPKSAILSISIMLAAVGSVFWWRGRNRF